MTSNPFLTYAFITGAHWELRTTQMDIEYPMNATTGSGNDLIANNDDECKDLSRTFVFACLCNVNTAVADP